MHPRMRRRRLPRLQIKLTEDSVAWRCIDAEGADWADVLTEVDRQISDRPLVADAWRAACEAGRGPDADADTTGWRHVRIA